MDRVGDRQGQMERYCSTGQSPQRAVAPTEEEEEEEEGRSIPQASDCAYLTGLHVHQLQTQNGRSKANHKQQITMDGVKLLSLYFVKYY